ncbi:MAG: hypothetical protein ABMB14_16480, partial [Myxococcota bacterium]
RRGGSGLLDRIAYRDLTARDTAGATRLEREAAAGTLPATLARWGLAATPPSMAVSALSTTTPPGNFPLLSTDDQIVLVEAYETTELGEFVLRGLPLNIGPTEDSGIHYSVLGIGGSVQFPSAGPPLVPVASIGTAGNVVLIVTVPDLSFSATVSAELTAGAAGAAIGIGAALCIFLPGGCPLGGVVTSLAFASIRSTPIAITSSGLSIAFDVSFQFDPQTERVEPFVEVLGSGGSLAVGLGAGVPTSVVPFATRVLGAVLSGFGPWRSVVLTLVAAELQRTLRGLGLQLPVAGGQLGLHAVNGGASSEAGILLTLWADVRPVAGVAAQPMVTQTERVARVEPQLRGAHLALWGATHPMPAGPPVGTYVGLGISQNTLNYQLFARWRTGGFEASITDPATLTALTASAPPGLLQRVPSRIHLWSATPPRVEVSMGGLIAGASPLVVFFDDVRACAEVIRAVPAIDGVAPAWELSFNLVVDATVVLGWPFAFDLLLDDRRVRPIDARTFELVDPARPMVMSGLPAGALEVLAAPMIRWFLGGRVGRPGAPTNPPGWGRPLPAIQQLVAPEATLPPPNLEQSVYLEILAHRRTMYLLPAIRNVLFELVDGSPGAFLNSVLTTPPTAPPVTLATLTGAQGLVLANLPGIEGAVGAKFP